MSLIARFFRRTDPKECMTPLYRAIVAHGREPHWYVEGAVPDTLDGRFDMLAAILCLVLVRLEAADRRPESVWLTELFIDDMEGQLRQIGIGDIVVGKHIGRMMSALGGRLCVYREGLTEGGDFGAALHRNLYRGTPVADEARADVERRLRALHAALTPYPAEALLAGSLPG